MIPPYLRPHQNGVYLSVKVQPRASANVVGEALGSELRIKVTAPPVDAAANEAVVRLLAKHLKCSKRSIHLARGRTSKHKLFLIEGLDQGRVWERLKAGR